LDVLDVGEETGCSLDAGAVPDKTITTKRSKQHKNRKLKNGRQVSPTSHSNSVVLRKMMEQEIDEQNKERKEEFL